MDLAVISTTHSSNVMMLLPSESSYAIIWKMDWFFCSKPNDIMACFNSIDKDLIYIWCRWNRCGRCRIGRRRILFIWGVTLICVWGDCCYVELIDLFLSFAGISSFLFKVKFIMDRVMLIYLLNNNYIDELGHFIISLVLIKRQKNNQLSITQLHITVI